jgi:hypothetical protein
MPITPWLHYADPPLAPICRSRAGSDMPVGDSPRERARRGRRLSHSCTHLHLGAVVQPSGRAGPSVLCGLTAAFAARSVPCVCVLRMRQCDPSRNALPEKAGTAWPCVAANCLSTRMPVQAAATFHIVSSATAPSSPAAPADAPEADPTQAQGQQRESARLGCVVRSSWVIAVEVALHVWTVIVHMACISLPHGSRPLVMGLVHRGAGCAAHVCGGGHTP